MFKLEIDPTKLNEEQFNYALKFLQEFPVTWERRIKEQRVGNTQATGEQIKPYTGPESIVGTHEVVGSPATERSEPDEDAPITAEVDAAGLPWDERIHSSNHKFSKDGTWQYRRGVDKQLVKKVEAELFALMQQPTPAPVAASPMAPPPPAAVPPAPPQPASAPPVAPPPPMQNQAQVPDYYVDPTQGMVHSQAAAAPAKSPNEIFIDMVGRAMGAIARQLTTQAEIDAICMKYSVPNMNMLITRQDICVAACTEINNLLTQRGA